MTSTGYPLAKMLLLRAMRAAVIGAPPAGEPVSEPTASDDAGFIVIDDPDRGDHKLAKKLRELATAMSPQIERKLNPATAQQNLTHRRAGIIAGMREDGLKLQETQQVLFALAAMHDAGTCPEHFSHLKSKTAVDSALHGYGRSQRLCEQLKALLAPPDPEQQRRLKIQELEHSLISVKIPGFFPTPASLVRRMCELAALKLDRFVWDGLTLLEPSAGKGDILDGVKKFCEPLAGPEMVALEISYKLTEILTAKGYTTRCLDFIDYRPAKQPDIILMNPPFEHEHDARHVILAYRLLKPGGVLVAITGEGIWFRENSPSQDFRNWFSGLASAGQEKLPSGSFTGSESFRQTGVAARMLWAVKPEEEVF